MAADIQAIKRQMEKERAERLNSYSFELRNEIENFVCYKCGKYCKDWKQWAFEDFRNQRMEKVLSENTCDRHKKDEGDTVDQYTLFTPIRIEEKKVKIKTKDEEPEYGDIRKAEIKPLDMFGVVE